MTIAHCRHNVFRIAKLPREQWKDEIEKLPDSCEQSDCGVKSCRKVAAADLRGMWKRRPRKSNA